MKEEEMLVQLRKVEEEKEDLEKYVHRLQKLEEEEEEQDYRTYLDVEQMREGCAPENYEILQLLHEEQKFLGNMKKKRGEFRSERQQMMKKKYVEMEMKEEDIRSQIQELHNEEENKAE